MRTYLFDDFDLIKAVGDGYSILYPRYWRGYQMAFIIDEKKI